MKKALLILIAAFAVSCSANWHIKRAIAKDPSILTAQTVLRVDTLIVTKERVLNDTVVLNEVDSVIIEKDRVITKIWRVHDTLRVETICPGDTVRIVIEKECPPQVKYQPETFFSKIGKGLFWILVVVAVLFVIRWALIKFLK
jgi:hypothetical protein